MRREQDVGKPEMGSAPVMKDSWRLEGARGFLNAGQLSGRVDAWRPDLGMQETCVGGDDVVERWMCVSREDTQDRATSNTISPTWPLPLAEAYVRGSDLVASYEAVSDWPYSPQIYWRAGHLDAMRDVVGSLSLLVSVQTHLLDTYPKIVVESTIRADHALHLTADGRRQAEPAMIGDEAEFRTSAGIHCLLRRLRGSSLSYAEFMPASDFRVVRVTRDSEGRCGVRWEIFAEFLEKGVIRRARVHAAFMRSDNDLATAAACCEAIERDALPLTV
jgi:hypothetical protein